ncbi:hypothetical protein P9D39_08990 [Heyndrickxia oleronia]|uniref:Uncharacterized protein n=1 Tax=Heyndrickxia oleronia TaxID=38875 RepID=A0A8E2IBT5_9BACI|nr:hypothetical protein [Heyndrickxia oleronia]MEC1374427.1 hypothetical protein [Heyndrickxia oleronia]OOP68548.1 hypothetical protein BWZ43_09940 [Heyndrickxia oleronia]QQZ04106.1 hypothetical protein I5818_20810 [Heyndrickxia oleronia]
MKKFLSIIITLSVLLGLNYGVSYLLDANLFEYSFFIGLAVTLTIWFFTTKGGFTTKSVDFLVLSNTNQKWKPKNLHINLQLPFIPLLFIR